MQNHAGFSSSPSITTDMGKIVLFPTACTKLAPGSTSSFAIITSRGNMPISATTTIEREGGVTWARGHSSWGRGWGGVTWSRGHSSREGWGLVGEWWEYFTERSQQLGQKTVSGAGLVESRFYLAYVNNMAAAISGTSTNCNWSHSAASNASLCLIIWSRVVSDSVLVRLNWPLM